ncbi:hypothetical protein EV183_005498 [Coemansia sp. RSA 2336]|nr:hypothetical protein EV183_005498 [Coemansia sp. RSA 2336]
MDLALAGNGTYLVPVDGDSESDTPYLQYIPSRNVAYGVGGVFAALILTTLTVQVLSRSYTFSIAVLASTSLMISQFLRGSLSDSTQAMYQAQLVLNTAGANLLLAMTMVLLFRWIKYLGRAVLGAMLLVLGILAAAGATAVQCMGVPMAFSSSSAHTGHLLMISSAAVTLGGSGLGLLVAAWQSAAVVVQPMVMEPLGLVLPFALQAIWASFALAQAKLPLSNIANRSEIAFYLLNVLPLGLVLALWTVINAPRLFSFGPRRVAKRPGRVDSYYDYPSLPADLDYSYPLRLPAHKESFSDDAVKAHISKYA